MYLTLSLDQELNNLYQSIISEQKYRSKSREELRIMKEISCNGFQIEYPSDNDFTDLITHSLMIPVYLKSYSRSKYNDEIDQCAYVYNYKKIKDWRRRFIEDLPSIKEKQFVRTGEWQANDWDDPLYAYGEQEFVLWYKPYENKINCDVGFDLSAK